MDLPREPPLGSYDYDLLVLGGGSGGLAVAKVCFFISLRSIPKYFGEFAYQGSNLFLV